MNTQKTSLAHEFKQLLIVVALVIPIAWLTTCESAKTKAARIAREKAQAEEQQQEDTARKAFYAACEAVRSNIKNPSLATISRFSDDGAGARKLGNDNFRAWGWVKGRNGYGLEVAEEWSAELQQVSGDWKIVHLRVGQNETASR